MACITGGIAEAFYGKLPEDIADVLLDVKFSNQIFLGKLYCHQINNSLHNKLTLSVDTTP